jgi:protein phosphatase
VILRAVGVNETVALDILKGRQRPGDLFLLCSDGLTDMVLETDILSILRDEKALDQKSEALIRLAKEAGGKDNVTVALSAIN